MIGTALLHCGPRYEPATPVRGVHRFELCMDPAGDIFQLFGRKRRCPQNYESRTSIGFVARLGLISSMISLIAWIIPGRQACPAPLDHTTSHAIQRGFLKVQ